MIMYLASIYMNSICSVMAAVLVIVDVYPIDIHRRLKPGA